MKKTKKIILTCLTSLFLTASAGGVLNYAFHATAQTQKTGFYVEDGAAVRLKSEHDKFGIKFSAQVGDVEEGAVYNILIAPVQLVNMYESDSNPDKGDIVTYLQAYAKSKGGKLSIVENCEVKDGKIEGSIVNVLWKNINRKFVGVAYYEKDGKITVADYADDRERSIVDVSKNALDSGNYTDNSSIKVLFEKVRYGEMLENGATEDEKSSKAYQYEQFYGTTVNGSSVTTAVGMEISLDGLTGSVENNVLQLSNTDSGASATIDFGTIPAGTYRVQLAHTLVDGAFTSTIAQNSDKTLSSVWDMKELGNNTYEFYFNQEKAGNASFTISNETTGTVTLDNIALEPVKVEELEYSRDKYMFGVGGLTKDINGSEGNWCDSKVTSEWMALAVNQLGVESQRVWMSLPHIITRAENSNELSINTNLATQFHNHFSRLKTAGVKRITVMLSRFVYPYNYAKDSSNCAPDYKSEVAEYKTWLEMQYQAFKLIAKEFPEITLWECGNEYDIETFLHKNGYQTAVKNGSSTGKYVFTNTEKAYITADICYLASKAFKLYNPENQIIMPGMSKYANTTENDPSGQNMYHWGKTPTYYFEELYKHIESGKLPTLETEKVTNPDKYFDIIAYHIYAKNVSNFETYNNDLLKTASEHGDGDKRVWITELGFTEESFGGKGTAEAQQAIATLTDGILQSLENKYANQIETVFFFRVSDTAGLTATNVAESCFGMYHSPNATEKANQAKPWAAVLYNYFNKATATVNEITFWKGSTTSEDFENVLFGENMIMNVGPNISLWNATGEIVEYNGGKALKVHYDEATAAYNSIVISFGTIEAGNYKVSLTYKVLDGRYSGAILEDSANSEFTYVSALTAVGNDTYCFYFTQAATASKKFTLSGQQWGMSGTILIDNISIEAVDEIPTDDPFGTIDGEQDFNDVEFVKGQTTDIGGVYINPRKLNAELVDDNNGGKALKVTKVESGYANLVLRFGDIEPGTYSLTLDVESDNYQGIMQFVKLYNYNGYRKQETIKDKFNNYDTLSKLSGINGNTYTFTFTITESQEDFAVALTDSTTNIGVSIIIDNIRLEKVQTVEMGTLEAGNYKLSVNVDASNDALVGLQIAQKTTVGEVTVLKPIQNLDLSLAELTKNGNTYSLRFATTATYKNLVLVLGTSELDATLDVADENVVSDNAEQTLDFENDKIAKWADKHYKAITIKGVATSHISTDGTVINLPNEIVSENGNKYFTVNYKGWSSWSAFNLGYFKAGTYTITMDVKLVSGTINGHFIKYVNGELVALTNTDYVKDGDTYLFKFTLAEDVANFGIGYQSVAGKNANFVLGYDNVTVCDITAVSDVVAIGNENFDNLSLAGGNTDLNGVYATSGKFATEVVADNNGGKKLQFTKTASGYSVVAISLGTLTAGNYKLTLDMETFGGYPAIMQVAQIIKSNGVAEIDVKQELSDNLMNLASVDGNTYTFRFSMTGTHENVAIVIASNTSATGEKITLDNVSLTEDNVVKTLDFENGVTRWENANLGWLTVKDKATSNVTGTLTSSVVKEENGNKYFTVNYKGWGSWSAFNLGYFKAGTYTITMDVKLVSGTINGNFVKRVGGKNVALTQGVDYTVDGDTYTFKITLDEDCANFGIGYQSIAGQNANFVLGYDNITVTVGTNYDGGAGDEYDWIDGFINKGNN